MSADRGAFALTIEEFAGKTCAERKGTPMERREVKLLLRAFPGWTLVDDSIEKEYRFKSYLGGLAFANEIGKIAEEQNHHPNILIGWRRVKLTLSTHSVKGLSENDFIIAARSELKYRESRSS